MALTKTSVAGFIAVLLSACAPEGEVRVVGPGRVSGDGFQCDGLCAVQREVEVEAEPLAGAAFVGWGGDCTGSGRCLLKRGNFVTATFTSSVLRVRVEGDGLVTADTGWTCDAECVFPARGPVTLSPSPGRNSVFLGFSGSCAGLTCQVEMGEVVARFGSNNTVRIEMTGSGGGSVRYAGRTCTSSCDIDVPAGSSRTLEVIPDATSFLRRLGGDCSALPCTVQPPGRVEVEFSRGRSLSVTLSGSGKGKVHLNGTEFCGEGTCTGFVSADESQTLTAEADLESRFDGFSGDCTGSRCVIPAGDTIRVEAKFEPFLLWARTFDTRGDALYADDDGIIIAMLAPSGDITIDGNRYTTNLNSDPRMGLVAEFDWDAGARWVAAMNSHQNADSAQFPRFETLIRTAPGGQVIAAGSCQSNGGLLNGMTQCNPASTPMLVFVDDGGISAIRTDRTFGNSILNLGSYQALLNLDGGVAALRTVNGGVTSSSLGWVDPTVTAAFVPVSTNSSLMASSRIGYTPCRVEANEVHCYLPNRTGIDLGDRCQLGPSMEPDAGAVLIFDEELRCTSASRIFDAQLDVQMSNQTAADTFVFSGCVGTSGGDVGDGHIASPYHCYVFEKGPAVSRFAQRPVTFSGRTTVQVTALEQEVLLVHLFFGGPASAFGYSTSEAVAVMTILSDDLREVKKRIAITSPEVTAPTVTSSRVFVIGDKLAMFATGRRLSLNGRRLSSVDTEQTHVLVFQR